ncbi:unnamed protein product, partial [Urochloa humidicola]
LLFPSSHDRPHPVFLFLSPHAIRPPPPGAPLHPARPPLPFPSGADRRSRGQAAEPRRLQLSQRPRWGATATSATVDVDPPRSLPWEAASGIRKGAAPPTAIDAEPLRSPPWDDLGGALHIKRVISGQNRVIVEGKNLVLQSSDDCWSCAHDFNMVL